MVGRVRGGTDGEGTPRGQRAFRWYTEEPAIEPSAQRARCPKERQGCGEGVALAMAHPNDRGTQKRWPSPVGVSEARGDRDGSAREEPERIGTAEAVAFGWVSSAQEHIPTEPDGQRDAQPQAVNGHIAALGKAKPKERGVHRVQRAAEGRRGQVAGGEESFGELSYGGPMEDALPEGEAAEELGWDVQEKEGATTFAVRVAPRASRDKVLGLHAGALKVALCAPPVDGEANAALRRFLAKRLGVPRGAITIVRGERSKEKWLRVVGLTREALHVKLAL